MHVDPTTRWLFIIAASLTILYFTMVRSRRKRRDPLERQPTLSLAEQRAVERDMGRLLIEYEEMIRRMTAQVETRAAKLEALILEADEKLARLERLQSSSPPREPDESRPAAAAPAPLAGAANPLDSVGRAEAALPLDPRHVAVYDLADQGRTAPQIAQQLNRPRGEIDLILALRGSMQA